MLKEPYSGQGSRTQVGCMQASAFTCGAISSPPPHPHHFCCFVWRPHIAVGGGGGPGDHVVLGVESGPVARSPLSCFSGSQLRISCAESGSGGCVCAAKHYCWTWVLCGCLQLMGKCRSLAPVAGSEARASADLPRAGHLFCSHPTPTSACLPSSCRLFLCRHEICRRGESCFQVGAGGSPATPQGAWREEKALFRRQPQTQTCVLRPPGCS